MTGALVFNRVFGLDGTQAMATLRAKGIDEGWLHYFMSRITDSAAVRVHDLGRPGISRSLLPLNTQWYIINHVMPYILTPAFGFGFNGLTPPLDKLTSPILKSVWSYSAWHEETYITDIEKKWDRFFVDRPLGVPVIIGFFGHLHQIYYPNSGATVSDAIVDLLIDNCRREFRTELGEVITFVNAKGLLTFCACSPYVGFSLKHYGFRSAIIKKCEEFISCRQKKR